MSCASATWWQATGLANMYEPSPIVAIDEPVGIGELDPHRTRQPPAEPARVRLLTPRAVFGESERVERAAELGDHGRDPPADRLAHDVRHPRLRHRFAPARRRRRPSSRARRSALHVVRRAPRRSRPAVRLGVGTSSRSARSSATSPASDLGRDRQVGPEVAHREPAVQAGLARGASPYSPPGVVDVGRSTGPGCR